MGTRELVDNDPAASSGWGMIVARAGNVLIGAGAFVLSFAALTDLARRAGISPSLAWIWSLIIDWLIVVATISAKELTSRHNRRAARYPLVLLAVGAAVSVSANAAHAVVAGSDLRARWAALISAAPPLILVAVTHLNIMLTSDNPSPQQPSRKADTLTPGQCRQLASDQHRAGRTNKQIADDLGVHPSTVGRWLNAGGPRRSGLDGHRAPMSVSRSRSRRCRPLGRGARPGPVALGAWLASAAYLLAMATNSTRPHQNQPAHQRGGDGRSEAEPAAGLDQPAQPRSERTDTRPAASGDGAG